MKHKFTVLGALVVAVALTVTSICYYECCPLTPIERSGSLIGSKGALLTQNEKTDSSLKDPAGASLQSQARAALETASNPSVRVEKPKESSIEDSSSWQISRDSNRLDEIWNAKSDDLSWLINNPYWNPRSVVVSQSSERELRSMLLSGRELLASEQKIQSEVTKQVLEEAIAMGRATMYNEGSVFPKTTASSYGILHSSAQGTFVLEVTEVKYPAVWYAKEAVIRSVNELHDSLRGYFDRLSSFPTSR